MSILDRWDDVPDHVMGEISVQGHTIACLKRKLKIVETLAKKYEKALQNISKQRLVSEIAQEEDITEDEAMDFGDYHFAYDSMIRQARTALREDSK